MVLGALPLAHLPELPNRGPGADMIARTAALLPDLWIDLQPSGWRFVPRPGIESRRAADYLDRDVDALEEIAGTAGAPAQLKLQVAGPWTLAAGIELHRGDRALSDPAAVRDITAALVEGLSRHVADVHRRLPDTELVVQVDEPTLPDVRLGHILTASGFGAIAAVPDAELTAGLRQVLGASDVAAGVHCCAADPPIELFRAAGAAFVSLDTTLLHLEVSGPFDEPLGEALEAGVLFWAGIAPAATTSERTRGVRALWRRLSLPVETMATSVVLTPTCGLAGMSPDQARTTLERVCEAAVALFEMPEGE